MAARVEILANVRVGVKPFFWCELGTVAAA
jgi:hypothetical protein